MNIGQQAAQAVHLAVEASSLKDFSEWKRDSNTVVLLSIDGVRGMRNLLHWMNAVKQDYVTFREPDQGNTETGYAIIMDSDAPWAHIKELRLLGNV